jgi:nitroreductase/NAD-dependent dihydropyrimidine dehydrogenase PreA subunit
MTPSITTNKDLCNKCGICILTCPMGIYVRKSKDGSPETVDVSQCISCGHCVAICPRDAIIHSDFPKDKLKRINEQNLPSSEAVIELLRTRRSIRIFQEKPVEKEIIEKIIDAAQTAPSSHNRQTTEYIVVMDKKLLGEIVEACSKQYTKTVRQLENPMIRNLLLLAMRNQARLITEITPALKKLANELKIGLDRILHNAPVLIIFHADERQMMPNVNSQLALQNAALMVQALGLGSFYTGYLLAAYERDKTIGKLLNLPEHHKIYGGLALGYPRFQYKKSITKKTPQVKWF